MDAAEVLRRYDAQRREQARSGPDAIVERDGAVVRHLSADPDGWAAVVWSDLTAQNADMVIAEQVAWFAAQGRGFEWKLYGHDRPADLGERLVAAGFAPGEPESLMVAEVAAVPQAVDLPDGLRVVQVDDARGVEQVVDVHERVFGEPHPGLRAALGQQLTQETPTMIAFLALADGEPVSAARLECYDGTDFAGLWGGGTLPEWRGRGLYRALVAARAAVAARRGHRYLQVDATEQSRPILERLGFVRLGTTTPYEWRPVP